MSLNSFSLLQPPPALRASHNKGKLPRKKRDTDTRYDRRKQPLRKQRFGFHDENLFNLIRKSLPNLAWNVLQVGISYVASYS